MSVLAGLLLALPAPQDGAEPLSSTYPALQAAHLRRDVQYLASDLLEGRETGERGEQVAGRWIESRFRRLGLEPPPGGYLQPFPAAPLHLDTAYTRLRLSAGAGAEDLFEAGADFVPHTGAPAADAEGPLLFAGYGLFAPEHEYDDFAGLDLNGKVVLLFRWEPQAQDPQSRFDGRRLLSQTRLAAKVRECERRGAVAVLVANPRGLGLRGDAPGAFAWPEFSPLYNQMEPLIQAQVDQIALQRTNFTVAEQAAQAFMGIQLLSPLGSAIPVAYVSQKVVDRVFASAGRRDEEWVREVDASGVGEGFETLLTARLAIRTAPVERQGRNVVGLWRGSDAAHSSEYVVVGAHYDHVGRNPAGEIWNGADDNGSGTAVLLGMAESFVADPKRPRRTLVFVAFSGEEEGLVGASRFLAQNVVPEERIAAMVNMDMVGRSINRAVHAIGTSSSPAMRAVVERCAKGLDLYLDYESEEFFDRSDQAPFYYAGVPVVFFNTSEHPDYHRPTDTWDKLDYETMSAIGTLARRAVSMLADLQKAPEFQDGYHRLAPVYGRDPEFRASFQKVAYDQRVDY
ncbi:MAG: M28 family peptidase [Planctomycetota bacterium]|nr:MAG: M28 family peptidase [Planctomycetota bacterium]